MGALPPWGFHGRGAALVDRRPPTRLPLGLVPAPPQAPTGGPDIAVPAGGGQIGPGELRPNPVWGVRHLGIMTTPHGPHVRCVLSRTSGGETVETRTGRPADYGVFTLATRRSRHHSSRQADQHIFAPIPTVCALRRAAATYLATMGEGRAWRPGRGGTCAFPEKKVTTAARGKIGGARWPPCGANPGKGGPGKGRFFKAKFVVSGRSSNPGSAAGPIAAWREEFRHRSAGPMTWGAGLPRIYSHHNC